MSKPVLIQDIVDALDMQFDEHPSYLDLTTGQVETVDRELIFEAEEPDDEDEDPDPEDHEWQIAKRIAFMDGFLRLPTKFDVHEWGIMEDFAHEVKSPSIRNELLRAISGAGAFRYFKDTVKRHRIEKEWYAFRGEALREIAIEWCESIRSSGGSAPGVQEAWGSRFPLLWEDWAKADTSCDPLSGCVDCCLRNARPSALAHQFASSASLANFGICSICQLLYLLSAVIEPVQRRPAHRGAGLRCSSLRRHPANESHSPRHSLSNGIAVPAWHSGGVDTTRVEQRSCDRPRGRLRACPR
jgi:hypothetical protein